MILDKDRLAEQFMNALNRSQLKKQSKSSLLNSPAIVQTNDSQEEKNFDWGIDENDWGVFDSKNQDKNNNKQNLAAFEEFNSFMVQNPETKKQQAIKEKKTKLEQIYKLSKSSSNKKKQLSELQQLIQHNNSQSKKGFQNSRKQKEDFFKIFEKQQERNIDEKRWNMIEQQKAESGSQEQQKMKHNSKRQTLIIKSKQTQQHFQTEHLLSSQSTSQGNDNCRIFPVISKKHLSPSLLKLSLAVHLLTIVIISVVYWELSSLLLIVINDLCQIVMMGIQWTDVKKRGNSYVVTQQGENQELSLQDQISETGNKIGGLSSVDILKSLDNTYKFHKLYLCQLYVSSLSMIAFTLFQMTQIDTFFTVNYWSLQNWQSIIFLIVIFSSHLYLNYKLKQQLATIMQFEVIALEEFSNNSNSLKLTVDNFD